VEVERKERKKLIKKKIAEWRGRGREKYFFTAYQIISLLYVCTDAFQVFKLDIVMIIKGPSDQIRPAGK
jgi:hypothetical protein